MQKLLTILTIVTSFSIAYIANACDFYGTSIIDKDVPTSAWKAGIVGIHPIIHDIRSDSLAKKAGLVTGDIILSINDKVIHKSLEIDQFMDKTQKIEILRGDLRKTLIIDKRAIEAERTNRAITKIATASVTTNSNLDTHERHRTSSQSDGAALENKTEMPTGPRERPNTSRRTTASAPTGSDDIIDELVEVTGHRRDLNDLFGRSGRSEIDQLLADTFTPALAERTFKECLKRRLDHRELTDVLAWYKTPIGAKIVEADSIVDFNRTEKALTYAKMDSEPSFKERMNLAAQIEKMAGASELETKFTKTLLIKMINAIPPDFPDGNEIKTSLQNEIPTIETKRKENIEKLAYFYRDLSIVELRDYLKFLHSATGKKYMAAVQEATEEIFNKIAVNIEKRFREYVMSSN